MKSKIVIGTWPLSGDYGNVSLNEIQQNLEFCYKNDLKEFDKEYKKYKVDRKGRLLGVKVKKVKKKSKK